MTGRPKNLKYGLIINENNKPEAIKVTDTDKVQFSIACSRLSITALRLFLDSLYDKYTTKLNKLRLALYLSIFINLLVLWSYFYGK